MESWIKARLSKLLQFSVPDDLIQYLMVIENDRDIEDYLSTLLNFSDPDHKLFLIDFINKKNNVNRSNVGLSKNKTNNSKSKISLTKAPTKQNNTSKKKTNYSNINSTGEILLKGRHYCDCEARKHELINNCMQCGRIVCAQEGSGPCIFCGNLVCSKEEKEIIKENTKHSDSLLQSLMEQKKPKGWEQALLQRNKLVGYDRNSEQRTQVIDDESDYFNTTSVWLSKKERMLLEKHAKEAHEKKHRSRLEQPIKLDFAGRPVSEEDTDDLKSVSELLQMKELSEEENLQSLSSVRPNLNSNLQIELPAISEYQKKSVPNPSSIQNIEISSRLQDKSIQEMCDLGLCLSMHQPYASLLIENIKKHEGRTWYTSHRGRLWIASTAKVVDADEVKRVENFYRVYYKDENLVFPSQYPSGCLLGFVTLDDCFSQEEYQKNYNNGESDSPYVFICKNPVALPIKLPIKGKHKIYKLESKIHQAGLKMIKIY